MTTHDLRVKAISVDELLQMASADSVLVVNRAGEKFVVEAADAFEREVDELGKSEKFMSFLAQRGQEPGTVSLEEIERGFAE